MVKTVAFRDPKYVGDPINAVRIFNEKEADELIVFDIDASTSGREPDMKIIEFWANECRMPLCYGGGVTTVKQALAISGLGVEKVSISAAAIKKPSLVKEMSAAIGSQSVVVTLDVRRSKQGFETWTHNGTQNSHEDPAVLAKRFEDLGAGEIIVNSIDRDGSMTGYDLDLIQHVRRGLNIPMSVLGGAGSLNDMTTVLTSCGLMGVGAGSMFVFKGPYRAVLINYPTPSQKEGAISAAGFKGVDGISGSSRVS